MTLFESVYRFFGWWVINIDMFLIVLLMVGGGLLIFKKKRWGKRCVLWSCLGFLFFGIVPVGLWTFEYLENYFPKAAGIPSDVKGMILLGGSFDRMTSQGRGEVAYNLAAGNFIRFVELAKEYPSLPLVYTGTSFEADAAKKEFEALGIDPSRVMFEDRSRNTAENAAKTAEVLHPRPEEKWILVSSAYHMPRSVGLFRKAGFNVIPYPVDYHTPGNYEPWFFIGLHSNLDAWHVVAREWLGMLANYLMGRSDRILPEAQ